MKRESEADRLTQKLTAFMSFGELVNAKGGYRPSLDVSSPETLGFADMYDKAQIARGDSRRANRY